MTGIFDQLNTLEDTLRTINPSLVGQCDAAGSEYHRFCTTVLTLYSPATAAVLPSLPSDTPLDALVYKLIEVTMLLIVPRVYMSVID